MNRWVTTQRNGNNKGNQMEILELKNKMYQKRKVTECAWHHVGH